jgi:hypothetical protein
VSHGWVPGRWATTDSGGHKRSLIVQRMESFAAAALTLRGWREREGFSSGRRYFITTIPAPWVRLPSWLGVVVAIPWWMKAPVVWIELGPVAPFFVRLIDQREHLIVELHTERPNRNVTVLSTRQGIDVFL